MFPAHTVMMRHLTAAYPVHRADPDTWLHHLDTDHSIPSDSSYDILPEGKEQDYLYM